MRLEEKHDVTQILQSVSKIICKSNCKIVTPFEFCVMNRTNGFEKKDHQLLNQQLQDESTDFVRNDGQPIRNFFHETTSF